MNKLLEVQRDTADLSPLEKQREIVIQRLMISYNLDRTTAAQTYETMSYNAARFTWGTVFGLIGCHYAKPAYSLFRSQNAFFRKPWMAIPFFGSVFFFTFHCAAQFPLRVFPKLFDRKNYKEKYSNNFQEFATEVDLVGKFRMYDHHQDPNSQKQNLLEYLSQNHQGPMTKSDLLDYTENRINGIPEGKRIKRWGRDKNDVFWAIGKVHGLENIAFLSDEQLEEINGDPVKLQEALNKVEPKGRGNSSYEEYFNKTLKSLDAYKQEVNKHNFAGSDRKKMLAMPFALAKRRQLPEPKKGQDEWNLFEEYTGKSWDHYDGLLFDSEAKITEFEYEKFIPPQILKTMDTDSEEFKTYVKLKQIKSKTEFEQHKENQEAFKTLMQHMAGLSLQEKRDFMHQVENKQDQRWNVLEEMVDKTLEKKLAKIQEEEAYLAKNRYRLDNETIQYADPNRMPVDKKKLRYILRQRTNALQTILEEIPNYEKHRKLYEANGQSTFLAQIVDRAQDGKQDFFKDIGLFAKQMPYYGAGDLILKQEETRESEADLNYENLINGVFCELDMTDYQDTMLYNEVAEKRHEKAYREPFEYDYEAIEFMGAKPQSGLQELERIDDPIQYVASEAHRAYLEDKALEALEAEAAAEEEEEDEDEDEGEDGEEGAEEEDEDYGDEYGEEDPDERDPLGNELPAFKDQEFLEIGQKLSDRFNQVELEAFMKLMGVKPTRDWKDDTGTHMWLEQHDYEDEHQERDPYFHMFGEIQRKDMESNVTRAWREGPEIKFEFHEKKPLRREYRF